MDLSKRPTMETMLARYRAFQVELLAQLGKQFGQRRWHPLDEISFGVCDSSDSKEGQIAYLPTMGLNGTYPPDVWHHIRDLVIEVGKKHGFSHVTPVVDRRGHLYFVGHDPRFGAKYDFGMEKNAVFGIETGCLLWGATPRAQP